MRTKRPPNSCIVNSYFSGCFKWNILDRYIDRLNGLYADGKYLVLYSFCYAEFLTYYYLAQAEVADKNHHQSEKFLDELVEENHMLKVNYPNFISLISSK